jgi:type I restriction enzyme S subunit
LRIGDLLTIQTGDIGVTTIVPSYLEGANCHALVISRFDKRHSEPGFYCQYFNSERGYLAFKEIETGSTMKHLNVGDMIRLFVPSPPHYPMSMLCSPNLTNSSPRSVTSNR